MKKLLVAATTILALVAVLAIGCAGVEPPTTAPISNPAPAMSSAPVPLSSPPPTLAPTVTGNEVNFRLLISDEVNAIDQFISLEVKISDVGVHKAGEEGGWIEPEGFVPETVDLVELKDTNATAIWSVNLGDGEYDKVFVYVDNATGTLPGDNGEDKTVDVKLPGNKMHISKAFTIEGGSVVNFVYDITVFEAGKSGKGKYILKPQIGESGADKEFRERERVSNTVQAGKSNIGHLYLYSKDADGEDDISGNEDDWSIVDGGAWGKMKYNLSGANFDFVFNGHGLVEGSEYTLVCYPDPWPGNDLICLGSGIVNEDGDVHIKDSINTGDLPIAADQNNIDNEDKYEWINEDYNGAKIWLVLTNDVQCGENSEMAGWNPEEYLFENNLITFDDTDV